MISLKKFYKLEYYPNNYPPPSRSSLKEAVAWKNNHFFALRKIFPQILEYKNNEVLEIGSGYGEFIDILIREGFKKVTASDLDKSLLSTIKTKFTYLDLTEVKTHKKYDLVFAFEVLEHIYESEKVVKNINKLLSWRGIFIFTIPYPRNHNLYDPTHINMQYPNYWTNLFNKNGFQLLNVEEIIFPPFIWRYLKPFFFLKGHTNSKLFTSEVFFIFKKNLK